MIALCLQCHKEADGGAFTDNQLRKLKANPFLRRIGTGPGGRFHWRREQLILAAGNSLFVRCPVFLEIGGRPIVWLSSDDDGNQLLNLDIWDERGQLAMSMRDNDWLLGAVLNSSAPDSLAEPMNLGVCSSMKPRSCQNSRIACSAVVCTWKISRRSGRRRSR